MDAPSSAPADSAGDASSMNPECEQASPLQSVKAGSACDRSSAACTFSFASPEDVASAGAPAPALLSQDASSAPLFSSASPLSAPLAGRRDSLKRAACDAPAAPCAAAPAAGRAPEPLAADAAPQGSQESASTSPHGRSPASPSTLNVARSTCLSVLNALSLCCPEWKKKDNFRSFYFHFAQISQAADRSFLDVYLTIVFDKIIRNLPPQPCPPPIPLVVRAIQQLPAADVKDITEELDALRFSSAAAAAQVAATSGPAAGGAGFDDQGSAAAPAPAGEDSRGFAESGSGTSLGKGARGSALRGGEGAPSSAAAGGTAGGGARGRGGHRGAAGSLQRSMSGSAGSDPERQDDFGDEALAPAGASPANGGPAGASTPQALRRLVGGISFNRSGNAWVASWVTRSDFKHRYKYFKTADFGYEQARLLAIRFRQHKLLSGDAVVEASELQQRHGGGSAAQAAAAHGGAGGGDGESPLDSWASSDATFVANEDSERGEEGGGRRGSDTPSSWSPARQPVRAGSLLYSKGAAGAAAAQKDGLSAGAGVGAPDGGRSFSLPESTRSRGGANFRATEPSPMEGVYYREAGSGGSGSASWQCRWSVGGKKYSKTFAVSKYGTDKARELAIRFRLQQQAEATLGAQQGIDYNSRSVEMVISEGDQNPVFVERDSTHQQDAAAACDESYRATAGAADGRRGLLGAIQSPASPQVALSWSDGGGPDEGEGAFSAAGGRGFGTPHADAALAGGPGGGARRSGGAGPAVSGFPGSPGEETPAASQPEKGERGGGAWQAGVKFDEATNSWKAWWRQSGGRAVFKAYPVARYGEAVAREKAETAMRAKALELQVMGGTVPRSSSSSLADGGPLAARGSAPGSRGRGGLAVGGGTSPYGHSFFSVSGAGGPGRGPLQAGGAAASSPSGPATQDGRGAPIYSRRPVGGESSASLTPAPPRAAAGLALGGSSAGASLLARGAGGASLPGDGQLEDHEIRGILELDKRIPGSVFLQQSAYCLSFGGGGKWVASWGVGGSDRLFSRSFSVSRFGFAQARAMAEHWRRTKLLRLWRTEQERKETASREALMLVAAGGKSRGGHYHAGKERGAGAATAAAAGKKAETVPLGAPPSHRHSPYSPSLTGRRAGSGSGSAGASGPLGTTSSALQHFLRLSQSRLTTEGAESALDAKSAAARDPAADPAARFAFAEGEGDAAADDSAPGEGLASPYPRRRLREESDDGAGDVLSPGFEGGDGAHSRLVLPPSRTPGWRDRDEEGGRGLHATLPEDDEAASPSADVSFDAETRAWKAEVTNLRGERVAKTFAVSALGGVDAARRQAVAAQRALEAEVVREYLDINRGVYPGVSFDRRQLSWRLQPAVVLEAVLKKFRMEKEDEKEGVKDAGAEDASGVVREERAEAEGGSAAREKKISGQLVPADQIAAIVSRPVEIFSAGSLGWVKARASALQASRDLQLQLGVSAASLGPSEQLVEHAELARLLAAHLTKTTRNRQSSSSPGRPMGDWGGDSQLRTPSLSSSPHMSPADAASNSPSLSHRFPARRESGAELETGACASEERERSRDAEFAAAAAVKAAAVAGVRCLQVSDFLADIEISPFDPVASAQRRATLAANAAASAESLAADLASGAAAGADGDDPEKKGEEEADGGSLRRGSPKKGEDLAGSLATFKGIHYSKRERAWVCRWTDAVTGKVAVKAFQEKKFGFEEAKRLAEIYRRAAEATGRVKIRETPATSTGLPLVRFVQTRGADKTRGGVWRVEWLLSEPEAERQRKSENGEGGGAGADSERKKSGVTLQILKPFLCYQFGIETGRLLALHLKKKLDAVYVPLAENLKRKWNASQGAGTSTKRESAQDGGAPAADKPEDDSGAAHADANEGGGEQPAQDSAGPRAFKGPVSLFFFDPSYLDIGSIRSQFEAVQKILRETAELEARVHHALLTNAPLPFIMEPPPSPPSVFASGECAGLLAGPLGGRDGDENALVLPEVLALAAASTRGGRGSRGGRLSTGSGVSLGNEEGGRRRRKRDPSAVVGELPTGSGDAADGFEALGTKQEGEDEAGTGVKRRRRRATPGMGSGRRGGRESAAARLAAVAADLISTTAAAQASLVADKLQSSQTGGAGGHGGSGALRRDGDRYPLPASASAAAGGRGGREDEARREGRSDENSSSDSSSDDSSDSDSSDSSGSSSSSSDSLSSGEDMPSSVPEGPVGLLAGLPAAKKKRQQQLLLLSASHSPSPTPAPASQEGPGAKSAGAGARGEPIRAMPQRRQRQTQQGGEERAGPRCPRGVGGAARAGTEAKAAAADVAPERATAVGASGLPGAAGPGIRTGVPFVPSGRGPTQPPAASSARASFLAAAGRKEEGLGPSGGASGPSSVVHSASTWSSAAGSGGGAQTSDGPPISAGLLPAGKAAGMPGAPPSHAPPLLNPAATSALNLVLQQRRAHGASGSLPPASHQAMTALVASALAAAASRGAAAAGVGPPGAASSSGPSGLGPVGLPANANPLLARLAQNPQQQACLAAAAAALQRQQELQRQIHQRALFSSRLQQQGGAARGGGGGAPGREADGDRPSVGGEGSGGGSGVPPSAGGPPLPSSPLSASLPSSVSSSDALTALRAKQALAHFQQQLRQGLQLQQQHQQSLERQRLAQQGSGALPPGGAAPSIRGPPGAQGPGGALVGTAADLSAADGGDAEKSAFVSAMAGRGRVAPPAGSAVAPVGGPAGPGGPSGVVGPAGLAGERGGQFLLAQSTLERQRQQQQLQQRLRQQEQLLAAAAVASVARNAGALAGAGGGGGGGSSAGPAALRSGSAADARFGGSGPLPAAAGVAGHGPPGPGGPSAHLGAGGGTTMQAASSAQLQQSLRLQQHVAAAAASHQQQQRLQHPQQRQ
ncbi:AP2 domain transcription factor AP2VIII-2 [Besnoitia besnoiti]|uniref:AP2 domain transcription factor AP2VIII-2 n=1 Tax=Besnoitia besnoiti TaxID=94643 RepID=A0A2A9MIZ9_BESBE|nr:AP2 domain transcription factor AP2VIII-2 [Besnoitia besnoiti]PFH38518.1 AP2 domain transcription factor AP2VIII-2 [Besnoitia besnoiti]